MSSTILMFISVVLLSVLIQLTVSNSLEEDSFPEIQQLSELLDDGTGPLENISSKEDSGKDGHDEMNTQDYVEEMGPKWIFLWQKRLEMYNKWLDHFLHDYRAAKPKTFARMSRGRLDRMPLAYGKRGFSHAVGDNSDSIFSTSEDRLPTLQSETSKTSENLLAEPVPSHIDATNVQMRARKNVLDRMPITFGKKNVEDSTKAADQDISADVDVHFIRSSKGSIDRMPLTFGKRTGGSLDALDEQTVSLDSPKLEFRLSSLGHEDDVDIIGEQKPIDDGHFIRNIKSRLSRMPTGFGKRSDNSDADMDSERDYFLRDTKSRLYRMPISFGKRQSRNGDISTTSNNHFTRIPKERLGRMPAMFGKRLEQIVSSNSIEAGLFDRTVRNQLSRMPLSFGKRDQSLGLSQDKTGIYEENGATEKMTKSTVDRMPSTYRKKSSSTLEILRSIQDKINSLPPERRSEVHDILNKLITKLTVEDTPLSRYQRSRLGRMPLTFGKRSSYLPRTPFMLPKVLASRMPLEFGQTELSQSPIWNPVKRLMIDRMPISFGKRALSDDQYTREML